MYSDRRSRSTLRRRSRRGFSLVEIMIVIVIIGLLAGVVTINVRSYLTKAKQNVARQDISVISQALDTYWGEYGRYPTNDEGLAILTQASEKMSEPPLNPSGLKDPWGQPYVYNCPASNSDRPYEIICLGGDNRPGGDGTDADISSATLSN